MKKLTKLLRVALVALLALVMVVSLSAGLFREVSQVEETGYSYVEYSLEEQTCSFRKYDSKLCYVDGNGEVDCSVEGNTISVVVNEVKIDAMAAEDWSSISIPVIDPEADPEADPTYLTFMKNPEPVVITEYDVLVYSDYIVNFLGLDKVENKIGKHYFNSIFCSLAGTSFATLLFIISATIKNRKPSNKKSKKSVKGENSLKTKIPVTTDVNPTQGSHNLKF